MLWSSRSALPRKEGGQVVAKELPEKSLRASMARCRGVQGAAKRLAAWRELSRMPEAL